MYCFPQEAYNTTEKMTDREQLVQQEISTVCAVFLLVDMILIVYIFIRYMVKLKIFGTLILLFYSFAFTLSFFELMEQYNRIFCKGHIYKENYH